MGLFGGGQVRGYEQDIRMKTQELNESQRKDRDTCDNFFNRGLQIRRPYEIYWYRNMAFYLGYQYITWDGYRGILRVPEKPSWRVRMVDNRIRPNTDHVVAKLTKNKAVFIAVPKRTQDFHAANSATISRKLLAHIQQRNKCKLLQHDLVRMMYIYGMSYKMLSWDADVGMIAGYTTDEQGKRDGQLNIGDIRIDCLDPFQVVWEEGCTRIEDSRRIGLFITKDLNYIRKKFEWGKYVQPEITKKSSSMEQQMIALLRNQFLQTQESEVEDTKDSKHKFPQGFATIKMYMELPSAQFPKGRVINVCNGILLEEPRDLPHEFMIKHNTFGIQKYDYIPLSERWVGTTPVEDQIPIQMRINRTQSAIAEIENEMAKPKWLVHKASGLKKTQIDNEPGEVIVHNTPVGYPEPHIVDGARIDNSLYKSVELNENTMENVSSIHETSKGMNVPGVESKVAMQFLDEQDQTIYGPVATLIEERDAEFYTWAMELAKENYKEDRALEIVGQNNRAEFFDFKSTEDFPTTIKVIPGTSFPVTLASKQQTLLNYFVGGVFGQPDQISEDMRMRILTIAQVGDVDTFYEQMRTDIKEAEREHRMWERGIVRPPEQWDNHEVMIEQHDLFRKSDVFRMIEKSNPKLALDIQMHIAQHMQQSPKMVQMQKQNAELEEQKQIALEDKALERAEKREVIKGKIGERLLSIRKAQQEGVPEAQTLKE